MTVIVRAWGDIAPKLWAFLAGGLTPTILVAAVAWAVYTFSGGRLVFELDATLAALLTTVIATVAGWFKQDGQLAGLGWAEISPKLLTLVVSSGLVTVLVAIASQLGFELPAWAAGLLAAVLPMIPGYLKADAINPAHAPLLEHQVLVAGTGPIDVGELVTDEDVEREAILAGDHDPEPGETGKPAIVEPYPGSPTVVTYDERGVPTLSNRADAGL